MTERITTVSRIAPAVREKKLKRVAAYARVSTGKDAMLHSLAAQVSYYSDLIQRNPEYEYAGVYADEGLSGTRESRPEFQRMLKDCRDGKIDRILCKSISRFARNTVVLLETVRELKGLGVSIYFEEQNIDTMSGDGEFMLSILASFAQGRKAAAYRKTANGAYGRSLNRAFPRALACTATKSGTVYSLSFQRRRRLFDESSVCIWRAWAAYAS